MLKKRLHYKIRAVTIVLLVSVLALIRFFQEQLFYDPFLDYFHGDFTTLPLPAFDSSGLFWSLFFRYAINSIVSLGIIYCFFQEMESVKFAAILYVFFFVLLILALVLLLSFDEPSAFYLFYIRRFLIQPVFVILFVPAFYYQKKLR